VPDAYINRDPSVAAPIEVGGAAADRADTGAMAVDHIIARRAASVDHETVDHRRATPDDAFRHGPLAS